MSKSHFFMISLNRNNTEAIKNIYYTNLLTELKPCISFFIEVYILGEIRENNTKTSYF